MAEIFQAATSEHIAQARELFQEYGASLGFSLCFQSFDKELAGLPGDYAPPFGRLLLAYVDSVPAGCVALHRYEDQAAEMKRLYVRPGFRGHNLGRQLLDRLLAEAQTIGYTSIRLDTVPSVMGKAVELYRAYGFREIAPYRTNPMEGALYMELPISGGLTKRE
jgi:ribosomal protein S18 acetylase RimI-like enzyme